MEQELMVLKEEAARVRVASLFDNWDETLIWTALQGMMGQVLVLNDCWQAPQTAVCQTGDFVFFAGDAELQEAEKLMHAVKERLKDRFAILTPGSDAWSALIRQVFGEKAKAGERYAIVKDVSVFNRDYLTKLALELPTGVTTAPIEGEYYDTALAMEWSRDFCSQFDSREDYERRGLGVVALYQGELVGGASSYIRYRDGIEIEVQTRCDWRRKGIASACCAQLILKCLERELYPSWDAANRESVALAEKLGYRELGAYPVWFINA